MSIQTAILIHAAIDVAIVLFAQFNYERQFRWHKAYYEGRRDDAWKQGYSDALSMILKSKPSEEVPA